ncbi:acyl-CoA N-acyltransferase [Phycomyces nitens]|nr:acyl-CoA N-acyltransferase [Phycomyces nitens]
MDTAIERARNIDKVLYGMYEIGAWYYSPYPSEFGASIDRLYICEHCLNYTNKEAQLKIHKLTCKKRRLPGKIIYQNGTLKIYEVDGREQKLFCQNLCLMAKLFVDHKTLYYDTEGFKFYVLTEQIKQSDIMVGYFSKEKLSYDNYNLACIMVLPTHQRKGYGRLLIELSYELSKKEGVVGSPEKPLSSLGALGYKSYWASTLITFLYGFCGQISISDISKKTCIHEEDIISTLTQLGLLTYSKNITLPPPPPQIDEHTGVEPMRTMAICITKDMLEKAIETHRISLNSKLLPECIRF